jgi:hypothetical protein
MGNTVRAYHFVGKTLRDGSPIPSDGAPLVYPGKIECCRAGYHASLQPFDALQYAPGGTLCLVEVGGKIIHQRDKLVAEKRTILARMDATDLLRSFACEQALSVSHLWNPPKVVMDYLVTKDPALRAAAGAAAGAAAWAAAGAAAGAAAWAAAGAAARAAARAAAGAAAWDAAWDAARDAARDAAGAAAWDAAWDAARAAARDAAWAAARKQFNSLVEAQFKGL